MTKVEEKRVGEEVPRTLDELARDGARRMIEAALEVEVEEYISRFREQRDEDGRALVVRNGHGKEQSVIVGSGTIRVERGE